MSDLDMFAETLDLIQEADSIEALNRSLYVIRNRYDVANIAYHTLKIPAHDALLPIELSTYGREWLKRYIAMDYGDIDPVIQSGRTSFLPLDWQNIERNTPKIIEFFSDAELFGVGCNGLSFPIHGAHGDRALFTVTANVSAREWGAFRLKGLRDFQAIGHYIHDRVAQILKFRPAAPKRAPSPRERQCLEAFGRGRTPKQIAAELQVSDSAVRLHLHSARQKLSCTTITQAVSHAFRLAIIDI